MDEARSRFSAQFLELLEDRHEGMLGEGDLLLRRLKSKSLALQHAAILSAAAQGMSPSFAWARASAASTSSHACSVASSDQILRLGE